MRLMIRASRAEVISKHGNSHLAIHMFSCSACAAMYTKFWIWEPKESQAVFPCIPYTEEKSGYHERSCIHHTIQALRETERPRESKERLPVPVRIVGLACWQSSESASEQARERTRERASETARERERLKYYLARLAFTMNPKARKAPGCQAPGHVLFGALIQGVSGNYNCSPTRWLYSDLGGGNLLYYRHTGPPPKECVHTASTLLLLPCWG